MPASAPRTCSATTTCPAIRACDGSSPASSPPCAGYAARRSRSSSPPAARPRSTCSPACCSPTATPCGWRSPATPARAAPSSAPAPGSRRCRWDAPAGRCRRQADPPPRLIYLTPSCQHPLGVTMPLDQRLAVLDIARAANAWVIEDDFDGEYTFRGKPLPAMQGVDDGVARDLCRHLLEDAVPGDAARLHRAARRSRRAHQAGDQPHRPVRADGAPGDACRLHRGGLVLPPPQPHAPPLRPPPRPLPEA